jgi:O-antigen ligase
VDPTWLMLGRRQAEQFLGRSSGPFGIPNSLGALLILLLPVAAAWTLRRSSTATERVGWGWVTAVLGFGVLLSLSRGAWLALAVAIAAWPFVVPGWRWQRRLGLAALALVALAGAAGVIVQSSAPARERLTRLVQDAGELSRPILWRGAWALVREQPLVGTGAGSFNVAFERHRPAGFIDEPQWAHNDYLNTLSDYGLIGFGLLLAPVAWLVWVCRSGSSGTPRAGRPSGIDSPAVRRGLGIGVLAFALHLVVEFHLKLPALGMTFAVIAALALGGRSDRGPLSPPGPRPAGLGWGWLTAALIVVVTMVPLARLSKAEALRYAARESVDREIRSPAADRPVLLAQAERDLRRAVELWTGHAGAWSDLARVIEFQAYLMPERREQLAPAAEIAARRALALSADVSEFWIRLGVALDLQGRAAEAKVAHERSLALAPRSSAGWYYYAHHLSRDTEGRDAALRAIATCLSLDPGNGAAEALRATLIPRP